MKVAIITDQHFGARKNSKLFHDFFLKFYNDVFFPTLEERGIKVVVDMGDTFDSRKGIDFSALAWAKNNYYDRLAQMGVTVHTIVGNHTAYYKNTNDLNAVDLLLREYQNVIIYSEPTEVKLGNLPVLFVPWINEENSQNTFQSVKDFPGVHAMGHLELNGYPAHRGHLMAQGLDGKLFKNFKQVFSGHYHTRSSDGQVFYLGNPYEIYSNDMGDDRGFHIYDTDTQELEVVNNPYTMYDVIYYEDTPHQTFNYSKFSNKIVKLIVRKKTDIKKYEKFVDKLIKSDISELNIIELDVGEVVDLDKYDPESEDTISILNRYVKDSDQEIDKSEIQNLIYEIYQEACEIV
jgi:UDP-2,3-diacylglucosamine pyrophosphatase LpxH